MAFVSIVLVGTLLGEHLNWQVIVGTVMIGGSVVMALRLSL